MMKKLIVGGLGIKDLSQITMETMSELKSCDLVLYLGTSPRQHIPELQSYGIKKIESIFELYRDGDLDVNNYKRLYQAVCDATTDHLKTVLLVPGHPRIGVTLVQELEKNREIVDFEIEIRPGISSFDTLLNDLARDPLEKGGVIIDANRLLLFETLWDASFDCYIYHICSVGTAKVHLHDAKKENAWDLLKIHLLKIYQPETLVTLVSSSTKIGENSTKISAPLEQLESLLNNVHFGHTLFIAGERPKKVNRGFFNRLVRTKDYEKVS